MKIAYSGTHGTGKTFAAHQKVLSLKKEHPEIEVGALCGVARSCPLPINKATSFEAQMWIFTRQVQEEIRLSRIYDILVCDRTVLDVAAYTTLAGLHDQGQGMLHLAAYWMATYDQIFYKQLDKNQWVFKDGTRETDADFRRQIDTKLMTLHEMANTHNRVRFE
jgi:hypothetical protein